MLSSPLESGVGGGPEIVGGALLAMFDPIVTGTARPQALDRTGPGHSHPTYFSSYPAEKIGQGAVTYRGQVERPVHNGYRLPLAREG